jgi:hypothetical protein
MFNKFLKRKLQPLRNHKSGDLEFVIPNHCINSLIWGFKKFTDFPIERLWSLQIAHMTNIRQKKPVLMMGTWNAGSRQCGAENAGHPLRTTGVSESGL